MSLIADLLMNSTSLPGYIDPQFWAIPAALAAFRLTEPSREAGCILTINGVPQHVLLARLNAKKGQPQGKKRKMRPAGQKGERKDGDRAEVKAVLRQHAAEDHQVQQKYEIAFRTQAKWPWRMVQKEARKRSIKLTAAGLAALAALVGVVVDLPIFA